jgi:hypothetical protein
MLSQLALSVDSASANRPKPVGRAAPRSVVKFRRALAIEKRVRFNAEQLTRPSLSWHFSLVARQCGIGIPEVR